MTKEEYIRSIKMLLRVLVDIHTEFTENELADTAGYKPILSIGVFAPRCGHDGYATVSCTRSNGERIVFAVGDKSMERVFERNETILSDKKV